MEIDTIDLSRFTYDELTQLSDRVRERMEMVREKRMREAVSHLEQVARELGIDRVDVVAHVSGDKSGKKKRRRPSPKFKNPSDVSQSWSGRGKKPEWVVKHLATGGKIEDLLIPPGASGFQG